MWWHDLLTALSYRTYVLSVTTHCWRDGLWTMAPSAGWRSTTRCTKYVTTRTRTCVQSVISYCFCSFFIFVHHRSLSCIQTFNTYAVHYAFVWIQLSPLYTTIRVFAKPHILKTRVSNSAFSNFFLRKTTTFHLENPTSPPVLGEVVLNLFFNMRDEFGKAEFKTRNFKIRDFTNTLFSMGLCFT